MAFSSRMKDYYDISYLAMKFDFEGAVLGDALRKTFANRNHHFTMEQFVQVMDFASDATMQQKWRAFARKADVAVESYDRVLQIIRAFLTEPYAAAMDEKSFAGHWFAAAGAWKTDDSM